MNKIKTWGKDFIRYLQTEVPPKVFWGRIKIQVLQTHLAYFD
jgi:hypothetical protein